MMRKTKKMMRNFTAAFWAFLIFLSVFANCFHANHHEECLSESSCTLEKGVAEIIAASGEHKDCDGDCPACSYLLVAQGAYFNSVNLPEKQAPEHYYAAELKFFHNNLFIVNLPRAPPFFIA